MKPLKFSYQITLGTGLFKQRAIIRGKQSLYPDIQQRIEKAKSFKQPYDEDYHYNNIQVFFDCCLHGDLRIDEPQNNSCNN